jgi:hypothetical protein
MVLLLSTLVWRAQLFGIMAIEVKRKAPTAHTVLEIIREYSPSQGLDVKLCYIA